MAFLAINSSPVSRTSVSIRSTSTRSVASGACGVSVPGGSGAWLRQALENPVDRLDHGLGIAGDQAALQQAFEIRRVQRPAMMAQHVGGDAACRFEPAGGALRRRLGEHQLLRLEKVRPMADRPWTRWSSHRVGATRSEGTRLGRAERGEATDEIVGLGIGVGRDLAGRPHPVDPGADLVETGQAQIDQTRASPAAPFDRHGGQHVLGGVQGPRHGDEIDDAGRALQRVKGAKRAVETLPVVGTLLQRQQVVVALRDELAAFDQELFDELVHAGNPHMMRDLLDERVLARPA